MYFEPFQRVNAANTGFPCPKVPIRRKLRLHREARDLILDVQELQREREAAEWELAREREGEEWEG
jgi:hypothetical protein